MIKHQLTTFLNRPWLTQKNVLVALLIYILLAPISYHLLPFMGYYGSDLSMQYFYNHCVPLADSAVNLFQTTGEMCGDANNTHYAYPVLIYRFFGFTKFFNSFEPFYYFWSSLIVITIFTAPFLWLKRRKNCIYFYTAISFLSLIQAPTFFALERGGTDLAFLIPWMLATYFGLKDKWIYAGIFMALAAFLKLYPAMAIIPILWGLFLSKEDKYRIKFFTCGFSIAFTMAIVFALDWNLWKTFIFDVLPAETKYHIGTNAIGHSLIGPFPKIFVYPLMIFFWLLYARVFSLKNVWYKKFAFAGVLAMSTYFNNHSFDYNLITAFPFIYLSLELYFFKDSPLYKNQYVMWATILIIFTLLGPANYLFGQFKFTVRLKLLIELFAFGLIPFSILKKEFPNQKFFRHIT